MKLHIHPLAIVAILSTTALARFSTWPENPKLIIHPFEAADCKAGRGIGAPHRGVHVPPNQCVGFPMDKSYHAVQLTRPQGQTCVLTIYTGSGCTLYPLINDQLDVGKPKSCFDTGLPYGWLGGGDNEDSWSVMYNCNLDGY